MNSIEGNTLPEGWEEKRLGDICKTITKGTTPTTLGFSFVENGINFLKIENIKNDSIDENSIHKFINSDTHLALKRSQLIEGDVLFSIAGTIGSVAKVNSNVLPANTNQALAILRGYEDFLKFEYLYLFLKHISENVSKKHARGGALKNISLTDIKNTEIKYPSLEEQKRIVAKIDGLFAEIDKAISLTKESLVQAKNLLPSVLKEVFEKGKADGWEEKKLEEVAQVKGGKRLPKGEKLEENETPHPYIRVTDFNDYGSVNQSGIKYISKVVHEHIKRYTISPNDVYISIAGTIGKTGVIPVELNGANLTENAAKIVINNLDELKTVFLYYFTLSGGFEEQIKEKTKTVAQPKLALTRLREVLINYPTSDKQLKIISVFDLLQKQTEQAQSKLEQQLAYLKQLKSSILSKAFKGEL
jgi:type I restriction enzyme S subunit